MAGKASVVCFSSFTFSYLNRAKVLFASVRRFHPDWRLVALLTDRPPPGYDFDPKVEGFDEVVWFEDLPVEDRWRWLFKHDVVEISTAVKGVYLPMALAQGYERIIYLDPATCLFNPLDPALAWLEADDVLLTPHQLRPDTDRNTIIDNEITSLKTGIYNLGFVAISNRPDAVRFAEWWRARCEQFCFDDIPNGLFVDQRWCDHVPALFENVRIVRDPGFNVASWNLSQRTVSFDASGQVLVNGSPLRFWHFTKLGPLGDIMTKKYAGPNFPVYELWRWYKSQVEAATSGKVPKGYWHFGKYESGAPIRKGHRILYRNRKDLQAAFANPFASGPDTFENWLSGVGGQEVEDVEGFVPA